MITLRQQVASHRPERRRSLLAGVALALLLVLAGLTWVVDESPFLGPLKHQLRRSEILLEEFGSSSLLSALGTLGLVHATLSESSDGASEDLLFSRRPTSPESLEERGLLPASTTIGNAGIVALQIDAEGLGVLRGTPNGRGRSFERPAFLAHLQDGVVLSSNHVGLRLHGGASRWRPARTSFRVHFRRSYGSPRIPPSLQLGDRASTGRELLVRRDWTEWGWSFPNALGLDIMRRVGVQAPPTKPIRLYFNGRDRGAHDLMRRVDREYLVDHFGHSDFLLARSKAATESRLKQGDPQRYEALRHWASRQHALEPEQARDGIDLEGLTRWFVAILFCNTRDPFQGPLLLDLSDPDARFFWVAFDMDLSFGAVGTRRSIHEILSKASGAIRSGILSRLFKSTLYRRYFLHTADEILNHRITPGFLAERYRYYEAVTSELDLDSTYLELLWKYLELRPEVLRQHLEADLGLPGSHAVVVRSTAGSVLRVDGFEYASGFRGRFFHGASLRVAPEETMAATPVWIVNGRRVRQPSLEVRVDRALQIVLRG